MSARKSPSSGFATFSPAKNAGEKGYRAGSARSMGDAIYSEGTYVGSCVAASMTEPYAVTRPLPLRTFTVTLAL